ncbi:MAG: hypothetical protein IID28_03340 [Planctomycetes bacterium]|nr:hypothetical protein [Planctomycetota bacterium]
MVRIDFRSQRALAVAAGLTVIAALLPVRWLGWTAVLAEIVRVPIQPMADAGVRLGRLVRPPVDDSGESEALRNRSDELERSRVLLHAARLEIEALHEEISAMKEVRSLRPGVEITPIFARVTGRPVDQARGPVRVNAGSRHGVVAGAVVVVRGGYLVGRVARNPSRLSCGVVPVTDPSIGLIEGYVNAADDPVGDIRRRPHIQLVPDGRGGLVGDLDREIAIHPGDVVRLSDPSWPGSAQGLIIGEVRSVVPRDLQPLLNAVTVRPRYHAQRVTSMTVIVERYAPAAEVTP